MAGRGSPPGHSDFLGTPSQHTVDSEQQPGYGCDLPNRVATEWRSPPVAESLNPQTQDMVREAASLMGKLFVNRRDVKAVYRPDHSGKWHWTAHPFPYTMPDFSEHLLGKHCLGTYLLNPDNTVKFMVFDIDIAKTGKYWRCYDIDQIVDLEDRGYGFDMDLREGPLEAALHDPTADAHRWVRIILLDCIRRLCQLVRTEIDQIPVTVITGGGAHVIVPLPAPIAAEMTRAVGQEIVRRLPTATRINKMFWSYGGLGELTIEVFPKQDTLEGKDYGNLIRLPYGWHHEAGIRTYSIDPESVICPNWEWSKISSLATLRSLPDLLKTKSVGVV